MAEDNHVLALTPEERNFRVAFDRAVECRWQEAGEGREGKVLVFEVPYGIHQLYEKMMHGRDEGYANAARIFRLVLADKLADRAVRSHVLTKLARAMHDAGDNADMSESEFAWFGRFSRSLVAEMPQLFVEWVEDMATLDPERGFEPQPTALIRGVLFSPAIEQKLCIPFWEAAVASPKFPMRVFSDPCSSRDGSILSSYQQRTIRVILENVSEESVLKIGSHMREHVRGKMFGVYADGRMVDRLAEIDDTERRTVFDCIASAIEGGARRALVSQALGLA